MNYGKIIRKGIEGPIRYLAIPVIGKRSGFANAPVTPRAVLMI